MKKKILFVTQQLGCGGVEKALLNIFNLIDRNRYECELLVIDKSGEFKDKFPEWLTIHEYDCPHYIKMIANYYRSPKIKPDDSFKTKMSKIKWKLINELNWISVKTIKTNISYMLIFNKYKKKNDYSNYDMLIDFHGYGVFTTYFTAYQKTNAKKVSWVHEQTIYGAYKWIGYTYKYFDKIFGVSKECCDNFINAFEMCKNKVEIFYNYLDINDILKKADLDKDLFETENIKIVSVGRVSEQKAFNRAVEASEILKEKGFNFKWIIVGDGEELDELKQICRKKKLEDLLCFVGYKTNPYAYIKQADLYVQTSRAEGFCTTISEAVVLGKPIVTTSVGGVKEQLDDDKGGLIVEHSAKAIANAIEVLGNDKEILEKYAEHNKKKNMNFKIGRAHV